MVGQLPFNYIYIYIYICQNILDLDPLHLLERHASKLLYLDHIMLSVLSSKVAVQKRIASSKDRKSKLVYHSCRYWYIRRSKTRLNLCFTLKKGFYKTNVTPKWKNLLLWFTNINNYEALRPFYPFLKLSAFASTLPP